VVAGGGERLDQQQMGGLAQRRPGGRLLGKGDRLAREPGGERGARRPLDGLQVGTPERPAVALRPLGIGVLGQRLAVPAVERLPEAAQRRRRAAGARLRQAGLHGLHERLGVEHAAVLAGEAVAAGDGDDQRRVAQGAPGPAHQHLDVGGRVGRGVLRPQRLRQHVLGHERPAPARQQPDQGLDQAPAERRGGHLLPRPPHHEPAEQPDLELRPRMLAGGRPHLRHRPPTPGGCQPPQVGRKVPASSLP
jgi:hypothetical protein